MAASRSLVLAKRLVSLARNLIESAVSPVAEAIGNTPPDYLEKTLDMRNPGPRSLGSHFLTKQTAESLAGLDWKPYSHEAVSGPAKAYKADLPGVFGMVDITTNKEVTEVVLAPSRKGTGYQDAVVRIPRSKSSMLQEVDFCVALVGPGDDGKQVLWTVFPGDPIPPSTVKYDGPDSTVSVKEALEFSGRKLNSCDR